MLNVAFLTAMLSVAVLIVTMVSVIMRSVVMWSVVAPFFLPWPSFKKSKNCNFVLSKNCHWGLSYKTVYSGNFY
jgi:hypothetical protein